MLEHLVFAVELAVVSQEDERLVFSNKCFKSTFSLFICLLLLDYRSCELLRALDDWAKILLLD